MRHLRRPHFRAAVLAGVVVVLQALAPASAAPAEGLPPRSTVERSAVLAAHSLTAAQQRMATALTVRVRNPAIAGSVTGRVIDAETGAIVWTRYGTAARLPASNTKVATALTALNTLGPETRFTTSVRIGTRTSQTVYVCLVGAGDPALSGRALDTLAAATLAAIGPLGGRTIAVAIDDSLFPAPTMATGWSSGYYPGEVAPVRALIVDQHEVMDTSVDAGQMFVRKLAARGALVRTSVPRAAASGYPTLAAMWRSPPVRTLVATMLNISDNDYAEALLRLSAHKARGRATWTDAQAVQRDTLRRLGVPLDGVVLYDGSGLSRSDRLTPAALDAMLRIAWSTDHPALRWIYASTALPIAGVSGSLAPDRGRFTTAPSNCAKGRLVAKTGTLRDVVALSGVTTGADGRRQIFSFIVNGPASTLAVKRAVDGLAATVTGCW
jgi:D-alanyl-D-alanine carboxypeptidase/D-alanyl-D-alanine-endopeptidase (penicillin-binding protein 4)